MTAAVAPVAATGDPWLPFNGTEPGVRLYCLPHAGGSASVFRSWVGRLGPVAVCPVQLPGRESRLREPALRDIRDVVAGVADAVLADAGERPYAVYGHSLGALVAFELAVEAGRRGGPAPVHLIVSGSPAPQAIDWSDPPIAGMSDDEVVALLRRLGGTPEVFLSDPAVLRMMILPQFRADFTVKESFRYRPGPPLTVPITAIASTADPRATVPAMRDWAARTTAGFTMHTVAGGHFAVLEQAETTRRHLTAALSRDQEDGEVA